MLKKIVSATILDINGVILESYSDRTKAFKVVFFYSLEHSDKVVGSVHYVL